MVFVKDRPQQYLVQKKIIPNYRLTFNPQIRQRFGAAMGDKTGAFEFPFQCYFCYFYDNRMVFVRDRPQQYLLQKKTAKDYSSWFMNSLVWCPSKLYIPLLSI